MAGLANTILIKLNYCSTTYIGYEYNFACQRMAMPSTTFNEVLGLILIEVA